MLVLTCPYCGLAAQESELSRGGPAHRRRGGAGEAGAPDSGGPVDTGGVVFERWHHLYGCGRWFVAARDPASSEVFGTYTAQFPAPPAILIERIRARRPGRDPAS